VARARGQVDFARRRAICSGQPRETVVGLPKDASPARQG
jgi:hypothetical protein